MNASRVLLAGVSVWAAVGAAAYAQPKLPRAELTPTILTSPVRAGEAVRLSLKVRLPANIHVQSNKPNNPFLIPTTLTLTAPPGVAVNQIVYPKAVDFTQSGRSEPLAVFGGEFTIDVRLTLNDDLAPGELVLPAQLRYQPCDSALCYAPVKTDVRWTLTIVEAGGLR